MAAQDGDIKTVRGLTKLFVVDGFQYQTEACKSYFLTHYHSDHTVGLYPSYSGPGLIYASQVTAALLVHDKGVDPQWVVALPTNVPTVVEGVEVTPLDANHCPGAVMFHFFEQQAPRHPPPPSPSLPLSRHSSIRASCSSGGGAGGGVSVLHVGDFRAEKCVVEDRCLNGLLKRCNGLDLCYLDTTYCMSPKHDFPAQAEVSWSASQLGDSRGRLFS
jgi:DNA cross-link repair 1A protein